MPPLNFKEATIRAIRPSDKQVDYWDSSLRGLTLRVSPGGTKTFQLCYRHKGRQRRLTLGRYPVLSLADARLKGRRELASVTHGNDPAGVKKADRQAETFKALALDYIEHAKRKKRSWREDARMIAVNLLPEWGTRKAIHVSRRDVHAMLNRIVARDAPIAANRVLSLVRTIFNFGIDNEWFDVNPCYRVKMPTKPRQRERVLNAAEIKAIWNALDEHIPPVRDILRLQLLTAQRVGEIRQMRRDNVDLETRSWTIPGDVAKNGRVHSVPLSSGAFQIVKDSLQLSSGPWVFPAVSDANRPFGHQLIHNAVLSLRERTSVADWSSHDLRRTVVSWMASADVTHQTIKKIINHSEASVIKHYDLYGYDKEKRLALDAWARRLTSIVEDRDTGGNVVPITAGQRRAEASTGNR
ncbi:MAG TPA: tyrosine-type recombinase/integrase [Vicinamibacterales bacterium]|nr:tyrosine-type recombinase/integrase [Vicinamibacterales bacterium]